MTNKETLTGSHSSVFSRTVAFFIDVVTVIIASTLLIMLIAFIPKNIVSDELGGLIMLGMPIVLFLVYRRGKTLGKKLLKIKDASKKAAGTKEPVLKVTAMTNNKFGWVWIATKRVFQVSVMLVSLFVFLYLFIAQPHQLTGRSMEPNYLNNSSFLTEKVSYVFHKPRRSDIIVFRSPVNENFDSVSRVIGLPGEKVAIRSGKIYINDFEIKEAYLQPGIVTRPNVFLKEGEDYVVPEGSYIVMSDNRDHSSDSRSWGSVPEANIIGRLWFVYFVTKR